jgi:hypothetical protein
MYHRHTFEGVEYITLVHSFGLKLCVGLGYIYLTDFHLVGTGHMIEGTHVIS